MYLGCGSIATNQLLQTPETPVQSGPVGLLWTFKVAPHSTQLGVFSRNSDCSETHVLTIEYTLHMTVQTLGVCWGYGFDVIFWRITVNTVEFWAWKYIPVVQSNPNGATLNVQSSPKSHIIVYRFPKFWFIWNACTYITIHFAHDAEPLRCIETIL